MGTVSAPIRVVALVGLLAALAMGAWMMTAGRTSGASEEPLEELQPVRRAESVATKLGGQNLATAAGKLDTVTPASPAPAATPAPAAAPAPVAKATKVVKRAVASPKPVTAKPATPPAKTTKLPKGTPTTIAGLLADHSVVVVLLYDAQSKVDEYSLSETALGAKNADAGFLRVDVRNEKLATKFSKAYGVLQTPSVLVFKRPGTLALKLNGFADHETVQQAALNAAHGLKTAAP